MGNFANGVRSESENVVAKCPERNITLEAQSLNPSPARSNGFWTAGMANAPNATTGVSFSSSRRFMLLNLRSSTPGDIEHSERTKFETEFDLSVIRKSEKGYTQLGGFSPAGLASCGRERNSGGRNLDRE